MQQKLKLLLASLVLATLALAQQPVKIVNGAGNEVVFGASGSSGTRFTQYLTAITTGGVTMTSTATYVQLLFCTNTSATDRTLTVADTQGSPVTFFSTVNIPANSVVLLHAGAVGLYMQGLKITASANSALSCQAQGVQ